MYYFGFGKKSAGKPKKVKSISSAGSLPAPPPSAFGRYRFGRMLFGRSRFGTCGGNSNGMMEPYKPMNFGRRRRRGVRRGVRRHRRKGTKRHHKKPSKSLIKACHKYKIKTTKKVGRHRVHKSITVLKRQLRHKKALRRKKLSFGRKRRVHRKKSHRRRRVTRRRVVHRRRKLMFGLF